MATALLKRWSITMYLFDAIPAEETPTLPRVLCLVRLLEPNGPSQLVEVRDDPNNRRR